MCVAWCTNVECASAPPEAELQRSADEKRGHKHRVLHSARTVHAQCTLQCTPQCAATKRCKYQVFPKMMRTHKKDNMFPQQRKLKGSSAQNSSVCTGAGAGSGSTRFRRRFSRFRRRSGRLWCRARSGSTGFRRRLRKRFQEALVRSQVRFNSVPEKVPENVRFNRDPQKGPEKVWEALVQSQVRFNRVPEKVRFNRVPEKFPKKVWEALVQPGRFNRVLEKVPGEGLGGFGAEPGQVQQGSEKGSGKGSRKPRCQVRLTGFGRRFRRRPGRGFGEGSGEGLGGFGAEPGQVQQCSGEGFGNLWCRARSGSNTFNRVSSAWLRSALQKDL